jgi:hypothetical protein
MSDETLNEILMRVAMTYTGDTTSYPFNEAMRRAAQFYLDGGGTTPPFIADRFYPTGAMVTSTSAAAASGLVRMYPFILRKQMTLAAMMARVQTVGLGSFQLAIYANDSTTMRPTGTVLARTGDMSTLALATVTANVVGGNVVLPAGIYWACSNVDATSAVAVFQAINLNQAVQTGITGALTADTASSAATATTVTFTTPMAYNTWSTMTGATFTEVAGTVSAAHIWLKAA